MRVERKEGAKRPSGMVKVYGAVSNPIVLSPQGLVNYLESSDCVKVIVERDYNTDAPTYVVTLSHEELGRLLRALNWTEAATVHGEFSGPLSEAYRGAK